ncbi:MAG: acetolactate synthase [Chloroflexi bacterium]|uniref:Acetolactate synthase n=1 Tax=Candidatus Chlorohelix allophototropha TaxID=3003348 RepID=A0A8T7M3G7_9CHLR|nr:acetolactate synthase [Chloroflexota bacterium]WJW65966.1 acetolactate synthase [Chloroflexota bacterium L227-S17]
MAKEHEQALIAEFGAETIHGGRLVARMLKREGVEVVFTLSGGHIAAIYEGCKHEGIRVVDVRHEQSAVMAAEGWARVTGKIGVALVTAGPGVTNAMTGIANAFQAGSPVIIIAGRAPLSQDGMGGLQELDHIGMVRPVTKYARTVYETRRIAQYVGDAFRAALSGKPGPAFLDIPFDLLNNLIPVTDAVIPAPGYRAIYGSEAHPQIVEEAAELLAQAERPAIMAGGAVWWCRGVAPFRQLVENLQIPTYLNGMGRGLLPSDHPLFFSLSRKHALKNADVLLIIGTPLDFRLNFGEGIGADTKIIWMDVEPREVGVNKSPTLAIAADVGLALDQIIRALNLPGWRNKGESNARHDWLKTLHENEAKQLAKDEPLMNSDAVPIHPLRLCREIRDFLDRDATVIGDGGDIVTFGARVIRVNEPAHWLDPGAMGTLGVGPGYAIAAKLARPDKQVLLLFGDGSFGLNGMDLEAMARQNIPVVCVIGNDGAWGQIKHPQKMFFGNSIAAELSQTVQYEKMAEGLGGYGERVERPEDICPALERAFEFAKQRQKPALINVITDPTVAYGRSSVVGL